jgi:hypothetical protein
VSVQVWTGDKINWITNINMTSIIKNNYSIEYKIFGTSEGSDFIAIIFPHNGLISKDVIFQLKVNDKIVQILPNDVSMNKYGEMLGKYFLQPFYLIVFPLGEDLGFEKVGVINNVIPINFQILFNGFPIGKYQDALLLPKSLQPIPQDDSIYRVAGRVGNVGYLFTGASWYGNFHKLLKFESIPLGVNPRLLDWGCGCGRLSRHFLNDGRYNVHGFDIDPVNIQWMQSNYGEQFKVVSTDPPTEYENGYFDYVIGHSVFTHLTEKDQFNWLLELSRISRRGARLFVTISALNGLRLTGGQSGFTLSESLSQLEETGYIDFGHLNVGVDVLNPGYYRQSMHTHEYIIKEWSKYFHIEYIVESFAGHQDLIVLYKN